MAKTRRDQSRTHRERRRVGVEDGGPARGRWLVPNRSAMVELDGPFTSQFQSSSPHRRERARKSTLTDRSTYAATRELTPFFPAAVGCLTWTRNGGSQDRVVAVVVGVTPHQGDGSTVTGRRTTGKVVQTTMSTEELDLMSDPLKDGPFWKRNHDLQGLPDAARSGLSGSRGRWTETYFRKGATRRPSTRSA